MDIERIEYGVTRVTHDNFPGEGTVVGPGSEGRVMVKWDTQPEHLRSIRGQGPGEHGLGHLEPAASPAPAMGPQIGGPFGAGDSVRFVGPGPMPSAYAELGVIPGRVFTVEGGTSIHNGIITLEGTSVFLRAKYFELVAKAKPKPPEAEWKPGQPVSAVVDGERRKGLSPGPHGLRLRGDRDERPDIGEVRRDVVADGLYVVSPKDNPEARYTGIIDNYETFRGEEDGFYRGLNKGHYTVVGPLVAIDPAAAREALADLVVSNTDGDPDGWVEAHESTILQALGIEAP